MQLRRNLLEVISVELCTYVGETRWTNTEKRTCVNLRSMAKWWKPVANLPQLDHKFELYQSGHQQTQVYTNPGQMDSQTNAIFQFASTRTPQVPSRWRYDNCINLKRFTAFIDHVIWSFLFFSSWYRCIFTFSISRKVKSNSLTSMRPIDLQVDGFYSWKERLGLRFHLLLIWLWDVTLSRRERTVLTTVRLVDEKVGKF